MRDSTTDVARELADALGRVVQGWSIDVADSDTDQQKRVSFSERGGQQFEARIVSDDRSKTAILSCSTEAPISPDEVRLMRKVASVFNGDLQVVGNVAVAQDLWRSLRETRFLRAVARHSALSTEPLLRCMSAFEAATRQTYEGNQFTGSVILTTNAHNFRRHATGRFHQFSRELGFEQALLKEKWLKPFLQEGEFALVSIGRGRVKWLRGYFCSLATGGLAGACANGRFKRPIWLPSAWDFDPHCYSHRRHPLRAAERAHLREIARRMALSHLVDAPRDSGSALGRRAGRPRHRAGGGR